MNENIIAFILSVLAGLVSGWLVWIFRYVIGNRKHLLITIKAMRLWNTEIRVSISYLFRIRVSGKYMLVKGNRIDQYQPVGGVFKMLPSFKDIKHNYEITDDDRLPIDETSKDDLRIRVQGKHLVKLLSWFYTRKNREVGVHREFYEEMIKTGILEIDSLRSFTPEYCKTVNTNIHYSKHFKCKEILIYEIYELDLTEQEEKRIVEYVRDNSNKAILASQDDICKECIDLDGSSKKIGEHAKHIL
ncbi:hypothetical protein Amet_0199 [Alkaliphilus metalliredigens QYMF]|uniref:CD-NTase-associated protein 16 NUDIX domain-containing protein n=1 Tax=Alkaliphilus metalliredigens (strain QYMF) TaxID=293826 RepID=A6TJR6_ALKMQ|nr:HU-CCDC81 and SPOR domain-containing protein [Alkaliphilus metalliredigens]ABR46434.1 hypothetical protein Amet_0199 [Alkaliphilus metalliredigens QYMF]